MPNKQVQFEQPSNILLFFNRFWIIITAILVGALLLGGYYLFVSPKINSNDVLRDNVLASSNDENNAKQLLKNLETLKTTYEGIMSKRQADLERLQEIVPNNPQVAELFVLSDRLAQEHGFQLLDINISDGVDKKNVATQNVASSEEGEGSTATTVATSTTTQKKTLALKTLTVAFKISPVGINSELEQFLPATDQKTNYQRFKDFLDALEKNLRLTDIQTVNFSSLPEEATSVPQFQFSVQTYYR